MIAMKARCSLVILIGVAMLKYMNVVDSASKVNYTCADYRKIITFFRYLVLQSIKKLKIITYIGDVQNINLYA